MGYRSDSTLPVGRVREGREAVDRFVASLKKLQQWASAPEKAHAAWHNGVFQRLAGSLNDPWLAKWAKVAPTQQDFSEILPDGVNALGEAIRRAGRYLGKIDPRKVRKSRCRRPLNEVRYRAETVALVCRELLAPVAPRTVRCCGFRIDNPDGATEPTIEKVLERIRDLRHLLDRVKVPREVRRTIRAISVQSLPEEYREDEVVATYSGWYQKIFVFPRTLLSDSGGFLFQGGRPLVHEVGHCLFDSWMKSGRKAWHKAWASARETNTEEAWVKIGAPTPYSRTDPDEFFAESFLAYVVAPSLLEEEGYERMESSLRSLSWREGFNIGR